MILEFCKSHEFRHLYLQWLITLHSNIKKTHFQAGEIMAEMEDNIEF